MDIFLDKEKLDITLENEKNIGDVLKSLEQELESNEATIIEIAIDKETIKADQLDFYFDKPIEEVKELSITSISYNEVKNTIKQLCVIFSSLVTKLEEIPVLLQKNQDKEAMNTITELADSLSLLFNTIPYFNYFPEKFTNLNIEGTSLTDFIQQFPPLMEDFLKAVENNDTVLIGDLSEYEIAPRLKKLATLPESL